MWKIFFTYGDKSKLTLTGKGKEIPLRLICKYYKDYGIRCASAVYQQYSKKDNEPQDFLEMARKIMEE